MASAPPAQLSRPFEIINGGGIMSHAEQLGGLVCAAQNCATNSPLSVVVRGRRCTARRPARGSLPWTTGTSYHPTRSTFYAAVDIPGVGTITATALAASIPDPAVFKTGRQFVAFLGLVPRRDSSGGKDRLGGIFEDGRSLSAQAAGPRRHIGAAACRQQHIGDGGLCARVA